MRIDDSLLTVMERAGASSALRAVGWQQLVDLLARRPQAEGRVVDQAFEALAEWRSDASVDRRARTSAAIGEAELSPRLFRQLALDVVDVAAPILSRTRIDDDVILDLLPKLSGPARALLRHRAVVSPDLARALDAYGPSDRALSGGGPGAIDSSEERVRDTKPANAPVPIRDLVDRIDRYRRDRPTPDHNGRAGGLTAPSEDGFVFETGRDGIIRWTDATVRGLVLGLSLAEAGEGIGVDDTTATLFARRTAIQGATLLRAGGDGGWRFDATPVFAPADGRFVGYTGRARRAGGAKGVVGGRWALARSDAFRQLMHELKTPLNAVIGFSELIEQQLLGPVPAGYRDEAERVRRAGREVLTVLEDVDVAAQLDAGQAAMDDDGGCDLTAVVTDGLADLDGGSPFDFRPDGVRTVAVGSTSARRVVDRLLGALAPLAGPGERPTLSITGRKRARLRIDLPAALATLPTDRLAALRIPRGGGGTGAPLLGVEFTLRLVRRLAEEVGGGLNATADQFILSLPVTRQKEATVKR